MIGFRKDQIGATAVEFALVAPTFLMFVFLILDGGRMIFAKQSLNSLAAETARCAAIKAIGCTDPPGVQAQAQAWAVNRGLTHDNLKIDPSDVKIFNPTTCFSQSNMAKATISVAWKRGAMTLLPQSIAPATLTATACFPVAADALAHW